MVLIVCHLLWFNSLSSCNAIAINAPSLFMIQRKKEKVRVVNWLRLKSLSFGKAKIEVIFDLFFLCCNWWVFIVHSAMFHENSFFQVYHVFSHIYRPASQPHSLSLPDGLIPEPSVFIVCVWGEGMFKHLYKI